MVVRFLSWIPAVVETRIPAVVETCIFVEIENSVLGHVQLDRQPADAFVELMTINSSSSCVRCKLVSRTCRLRYSFVWHVVDHLSFNLTANACVDSTNTALKTNL